MATIMRFLWKFAAIIFPVAFLVPGATITGSRSGLFWKNVPGGLPAILDVKVHTGNVFFVDANAAQSGTTAGYGTHPDKAFSTIDAAINACFADQGDVIYVLPGHTETLADATSLVPDVDGVSIVGLGVGAARPTLTLSATGSNIPISGDSVVFKNFLITTVGTINVSLAITVTGDDCVVEDVEMREASTISQIVVGLFLNVALRVKVRRFVFLGLAGDATVTAIRMTGSTGLEIEGCRLVGNFQGSEDATGAIQSLTTLNVDIDIHHNRVENRDGTSEAGIVFVATDTGFVWENFIAVPTSDFGQGIVVDTAMRQFNNYVVDVATERGLPEGTGSA